MKVISKKALTKSVLMGKAKMPKKPEKTTGHDVKVQPLKPEKTTGHDIPFQETKPLAKTTGHDTSDQVAILKQLKASIDTTLHELETGAKSIQEGLRNVDKSIKAIDIPAQVKPVTNLTVSDIERDTSGNMTGFQIKAIRGG